MDTARRTLLAAALGAFLLGASGAGAAPTPKIDNYLSRPLAPDDGAFLQAALQAPAPGSCDVLSPDPGYVEEMLVRFSTTGEKIFERRVYCRSQEEPRRPSLSGPTVFRRWSASPTALPRSMSSSAAM